MNRISSIDLNAVKEELKKNGHTSKEMMKDMQS